MILQKTLPGLASTPETFTLRPYQQACVDAVFYGYFYCNKNKGLIEMPTGAGKTLTALSILHKLRTIDPHTTGLLIAPTIDLALKNFIEARRFFRHEEVGLVQAENRFYNHPIVVATTDTLANPVARRKLLFAQEFTKFSFVWIDEAHTKSIGVLRDILADLEHPYALRLGVSATPYREDGKSLEPVFPNGFFYQIGIHELVVDNYLLPFQIHQIHTTPKDRPKAALKAWQDIIGQEPTIVFAKSVPHAYTLNKYFKSNNVRSAVISSRTSRERRTEIYQEFRNNTTPIMNNFGVLTTGVDFPEARAAIIVRDAWMKGKISVVHRQAIGRVIRLCQGKQVGKIIYLCIPGADKVPGERDLLSS
jgi:DNA repair protein RadD